MCDENRYFAWNSTFNTGNPKIDESQKEQLEKLDTIVKQISDPELQSGIVSTIDALILCEATYRNEVVNNSALSEERLQEAMEYAKIGHWDLPFNSNRAYWSPQMYTLFGLTTDSVSGPETLCSIMKRDYHDPFYCSVSTAFETGCEHHVEYPIVRPSDGATRWIECRGKVVYKEDGTPEKLTGFVQDITAHKDNESRIEQLAYYDPLTHLPNRRLLLERLNHTLASSERSRDVNALLFLDIDNFKTLNDLHGHDYGDLLLAQAATRITRCIRNGDTASRIGGDEFVIILEKLSSEPIKAATQAEAITQKILNFLSKPYQINEVVYTCTCSVGIVFFNNNQATATELMKQADIAMYQAKRDGRNTHCFFDPEMQKDIATRAILESDLRQALIKQELELYYQPQVDKDNNIVGAETLIRWNHPTSGLTTPQDFIPLAEDTGLIVPMGEWILRDACLQLSKWQSKEHTKHLSLAVNVSYKQFQQPSFCSILKQIIEEYKISPSKLKIELTESMLAEDLELAVDVMQTIESMGILISLDDFGTGYSSLQYLKTLPIYQLKIDRSFVQDIMTDPSDRSIVKTIISMTEGLGLDVIAEGVETQEQRQYLLDEGCGFFQGYLFSKPLPLDEFEKMLSAKS